MRLTGQGKLMGLAAAVAVAAVSSGCGADHATKSTAPVNIVITSIVGRAGLAGDESSVLDSDVLNVTGADTATPKVSIVEDYAVLTVANYPKNPTLIDQDNIAIGTYGNVLLERFEVHFYRTDGLNTEGVDVPYSFSGPLAAMVPFNGTAEVPFVVVRHQAKMEPPLLNMDYNVGGSFFTAYAEITIHGRTLADEAVETSGRLQINFGDFGNE